MGPHTSAFKLYLAGFRAALADNLYETDVKASSTVDTYCQQVIWVLKQRDSEAVNSAVSRGVNKQLQDGKRYQGSLDLSFYGKLYSMVFEMESPAQHLKLVRNLLLYSFLGFATQRSQSAVISNPKHLTDKSRILFRGNVRLNTEQYAIWWALTRSKGDPFGKRKGKDRKDWTPIAGYSGSRHPIDIVRLHKLYCKLMGFSLDTSSKLFR